tara:strand:- start:2517 stop:2870 length:354 start_codon:yes stop_codon:yes gene_type:complete
MSNLSNRQGNSEGYDYMTLVINDELSPSAREVIENTITQHAKYRNSFLWNSSMKASTRRWKEANVWAAHPGYNLVKGADVYRVRPYYRESAKNVYYRLDIQVNNVKKNISALKKLLK